MRQNRLFTSIYVAGTGLSVALLMTLFIIFYVKFAPIYPEYNRNRTLVISEVQRSEKSNSGNWSRGEGTSYAFTLDLQNNLKNAEAIAAVAKTWVGNSVASRIGSDSKIEVEPSYVNADFWKVFTFNFTSGIPFTSEEIEATLPVAVISKGLALRLFAQDNPVGEKFYLDGTEFSIIGIVQDVSDATPATAGEVWIPLTHNTNAINIEGWDMGLIGGITNYLMAPTASQKEALRDEVIDYLNRYNNQDDTYTHEIFGQPDPYWLSTFRIGMGKTLDPWDVLNEYFYILLAFLFIPALNLSGLISNRMESRMSELGLRKAYGATNMQIISQVLWENFLLTLIGGLVGLLLSYLIVITAKDWLLTLFDSYILNPSREIAITPEMLFNPIVFGSVLLFCILLNFISALIPSAWALRRSIISSIHTKR